MTFSEWALAFLWLVGIAVVVAVILALVWLADPAGRRGGVPLVAAGPSGPVGPTESGAAGEPSPDVAGPPAPQVGD